MNLKASIKGLCERLEMSRQNYYKGRKERRRAAVDAELTCRLARRERAIQPRLGGRKLFHLLRAELVEHGVKLGRDRFFDVLRENSLLLEKLPSFAPKTTNSRHSLPVFHNLVKGMTLSGRNQAWASDITYIRTDEGFIYLALISDMWSRKIVGYHAGDTLEAAGALRALEQAVLTLGEGERPVHHSDRGCQYCCHAYVGALRGHGLGISMTEEAHCYENALAERVNGILKQEYGLGGSFKNKADALKAIDEAVWLFNTKRPHLSLRFKTPDRVHFAALAA